MIIEEQGGEGLIMADCSYIPECDFYHDRLDVMPMTAEFIKMIYCHKESRDCARYLYQSLKESSYVPGDLMPNDSDFLGKG